MAAVLQSLGLPQKWLSNNDKIRQSAISDFLKPGATAGLPEAQWEEMQQRLKAALADAADDLRRQGSYEIASTNLDILTDPERLLSVKRAPQPPGAVLQLEAASYIERAADAASVFSVRNEIPIAAIYGGPRSGKTSLLWRVRERAERLQRGVSIVSLKDALRDKRDLDAAGVFQTIFEAMSPDSAEWRDGASMDEVLREGGTILRKLRSGVGRAPPLLLLDDVDALIDVLGHSEQLSRIYSTLFDVTRKGMMHVWLTSSGLLPHLAYVSSLFGTAENIFLQPFGLAHIGQMAAAYRAGEVSDAVREEIRHVTAGNPEVIHLLFDHVTRNKNVALTDALSDLLVAAQKASADEMDSLLTRRAILQRGALLDWLERASSLAQGTFGASRSADTQARVSQMARAMLEQIVGRERVGEDEATRQNLKRTGYVEITGLVEAEFYRECAKHLLAQAD